MDRSFDNDNTDANIYFLYVTRINICFMHTTKNSLYKKLYLLTHTANKPCPKDIRTVRTLCIKIHKVCFPKQDLFLIFLPL